MGDAEERLALVLQGWSEKCEDLETRLANEQGTSRRLERALLRLKHLSGNECRRRNIRVYGLTHNQIAAACRAVASALGDDLWKENS